MIVVARRLSLILCAAFPFAQAQVTITPAAADMTFGEEEPRVFRAAVPGAVQPAWRWSVVEADGGDIRTDPETGAGIYRPPFVLEKTRFRVRAVADHDPGLTGEATVEVSPMQVFTLMGQAWEANWAKPRMAWFAGGPGGAPVDGPPDRAQFTDIQHLLFVPDHPDPRLAGKWLVLDGKSLRTVSPQGEVATYQPTLADQPERGPVAAPFQAPACLALAPRWGGGEAPLIFISDPGRSVIWALDGQGRLRIHAGVPGRRGHADGKDQALFHDPRSLWVDEADKLWVVDAGNAVIRTVTPEGRVDTVAGKRNARALVDGSRGVASLYLPKAVVRDPATGDLLLGDHSALRRITAAGTIAPQKVRMASGTKPFFGDAQSMTLRGNDLYLVERLYHRVRRLDLATGELSSLLGAADQDETRCGQLPDGAAIRCPVAIGFDRDGTCLVADRTTLYELTLPARPAEERKDR